MAKDSGAQISFAEEVCDWLKACCWAVFAGQFGMGTRLVHLSGHPIMISLERH